MIVYKVTTQGDVEGRTTETLGYATGDPNDIKAFFDDKKYYDISLQEIQIENVTPQAVIERKNLIARKKELELELKRINSKI